MFVLLSVFCWLIIFALIQGQSNAPRWCRGGGGDTTTVQVPAPQSTTSSMADYVASLPALYQAQLQYEPQMQQMSLNMLQQYGTQFGQAARDINQTLYPETAALQEQLASQAGAGMNADMPQWAKDSYRNEMNANLGTNAGSPIGADYASRGMLEQQKNWQDYYRNLALSTSGRQPLAQGGTTPQTNYMQGYQPQQALQNNASGYNAWAGSMNSMYQPSVWGQIGGGLAQGIGSGIGMGAGAAMFG
jgi:hypothetical protein